jgi:hypothetical protein
VSLGSPPPPSDPPVEIVGEWTLDITLSWEAGSEERWAGAVEMGSALTAALAGRWRRVGVSSSALSVFPLLSLSSLCEWGRSGSAFFGAMDPRPGPTLR